MCGVLLDVLSSKLVVRRGNARPISGGSRVAIGVQDTVPAGALHRLVIRLLARGVHSPKCMFHILAVKMIGAEQLLRGVES